MFRAYSKTAGTGKREAADPARVAAAYAEHLLTTLGVASEHERLGDDRHPALAWAASGAMALTGRSDGPPVVTPGHLAAAARGTVHAFDVLANGAVRDLDGAALLGERAAVLGLGRRGTISAGGSCRLLRARDGWIAVNLPRPEDVAAVPAWLETALGAEPWETIAAMVACRRARPLVARARLLGLAAAEASSPPSRPSRWCRVVARGARVPTSAATPLVVDLSSLWAGPLATHLLALAGARVIKVESPRRPDGARRGPAAFFDLLNAGKESVALDLGSASGVAALRRLLSRADIVVESSRPRALAQLGIDAPALVAERPGLTWVGISGYGRRGRGAGWIAFGDDAAAAAGLASATGANDGGETPLFCADAIADPLSGLHAAVAALGAWRRGGGVLLSLALRDVAAHALTFGPAVSPASVRRTLATDCEPRWELLADGEVQVVRPPSARTPRSRARPLGDDTDSVVRHATRG